MAQTAEAYGTLSPPVLLTDRPSWLARLMPCAVVFVAGYLFSTWFLHVYRWGDQEYYDRFWRAMVWTHPALWSRLQLEHLSAAEPLYRYIIGFGTYFDFDRIAYLSVWNGILLSSVAYALVKHRSSITFAILVFTNYYILVLLGPAERLKFAYLLLILAFCFDNAKIKSVLGLSSGLAHTQAVVQFISGAIYFVALEYKKIFASKIRAIAFVIVSPVALALAGYYLMNSVGDVVAQKAEFYVGESQGVLESFQWALILVCGMIVFDKRIQFILGMLPMGALTSFYGSRINVATLAFFCAIALSQRRTVHPLVLLVMAYMSFKSIGFMLNVLSTGQGF